MNHTSYDLSVALAAALLSLMFAHFAPSTVLTASARRTVHTIASTARHAAEWMKRFSRPTHTTGLNGLTNQYALWRPKQMELNQYEVNLTPRTPTRDIEEALSEIERELRVRERCFGRWVREGKLTRIDAIDRLERLTSAWLYLDKLLTLNQPETIPASEGGPDAPQEAP